MASYNSDAPILDTYQTVVSAYSDFLTVAIHTILYERNIYPQASFIKARKYDYPVKQNRHPKVCKWIQDAVAAVEAEMLKVRSSGATSLSDHHLLLPSLLCGFHNSSIGNLPSQDRKTKSTGMPLQFSHDSTAFQRLATSWQGRETLFRTY